MSIPTVLVDTTFSGKDIYTSGAASVYEYTATADVTIRLQVRLAAVAGNGDYTAHLTLNDGDAQSDDAIGPRTTYAAASGETAFWFATMQIDLRSGDVINVKVLGLAGDTSEAGSIRIFTDGFVQPTTAGHTLTLDGSGGVNNVNNVYSLAAGSIANDTIDDGAITAAKIATDAIDADAIKADAVTEIQSGLATSANQTTILARIGAFTGTGVNTILGFLKAAMSKAATLPTDIGGTFAPSTDSLEALANKFASSSVSTIGVVDGDDHTWYRGSAQTATITLGVDITGYTNVIYALKSSKADADSASVFYVDIDTGLVYLNGAAIASPVVVGDASLTVVTEATGVIAVTINSRAAYYLDELQAGVWGVKVVYTDTTDAVYVGGGTANVALDIPKAVA